MINTTIPQVSFIKANVSQNRAFLLFKELSVLRFTIIKNYKTSWFKKHMNKKVCIVWLTRKHFLL